MTLNRRSKVQLETGSVMLWAVLPAAWHRHAGHLRQSAELLWGPLDRALTLRPPFHADDLALGNHVYAFLLVAGAALEAMIKAAAIQAAFNVGGFKAVITERNQLQGWVTTHSLVRLAERAKLPLSVDEEDQLKRFTKYVVWAGSYPVPKDLRLTAAANRSTNRRVTRSTIDRMMCRWRRRASTDCAC